MLVVTLLVLLLSNTDLDLVLFNLPPGDLANGEIGLAALPGREQDFSTSLDLAAEYARVCECERVHVMAGRLDTGEQRTLVHDVTFANNLVNAVERMAEVTNGKTQVCIEPLNQRSAPGYYLKDTHHAREVIDAVSKQLASRRIQHDLQVRLQFDFFHLQIIEGDVTTCMRECFDDGVVGEKKCAIYDKAK